MTAHVLFITITRIDQKIAQLTNLSTNIISCIFTKSHKNMGQQSLSSKYRDVFPVM